METKLFLSLVLSLNETLWRRSSLQTMRSTSKIIPDDHLDSTGIWIGIQVSFRVIILEVVKHIQKRVKRWIKTSYDKQPTDTIEILYNSNRSLQIPINNNCRHVVGFIKGTVWMLVRAARYSSGVLKNRWYSAANLKPLPKPEFKSFLFICSKNTHQGHWE